MRSFLIVAIWAHAFGIMLIVAAARTLYLIRQMDDAASVLQTPRRVAALRAWWVKVEAPVFAIAGCFAWIPLMLMELARHGVDLIAMAPGLLADLLLLGCVSLVAVVIVFGWVPRIRLRYRFEGHLAGTNMQKADAMLEDVARFKQELP